MKLRDLYRVNSRRGLLLSILVHLLLVVALTATTIQLTTPDGFVTDGEIDIATSDAGAPTPVEIQSTTPIGIPEAEKTQNLEAKKKQIPKQPVVVATPPPVDQKIEKQEVEVPTQQPSIKPKAWKPVEETDVDDTAGGSIPKEEEPAPKNENLSANAEEKNTESSGTASNAQEEGQTQAQQQGTDEGDEGAATGNNSGPVHSEKELKALAGNSYNYPLMARVQRLEGTVVLRFTLQPNGEVAKVWVQQSSGNQILDRAAAEAHAKWKYEEGIEGVIQKKVIFSLKGPATILPATR
jgi:protein TonB